MGWGESNVIGNNGETMVKHKRLDILIPPFQNSTKKIEVASTQEETFFPKWIEQAKL